MLFSIRTLNTVTDSYSENRKLNIKKKYKLLGENLISGYFEITQQFEISK